MNESVMKFFDNLDLIARQLKLAIENGDVLPDGAAEAVAKFNNIIQELELISQKNRLL